MPPSQWDNVGNAGDTLKHAPISELVEVLLALSTRVAYLDPFAFALEAPLAASVGYGRWRKDLVERRRVWPGYGRFLSLQEPRLLAGGTYRCGMGLALDAIGRGQLSWLLAAERDSDLRERLEAGLRHMGLAGSLVGGAILHDANLTPAAIATNGAVVEAGEGLFALIDPFNVRNCPWEEVLEGLALALRPGAHAVTLAFTYGGHDWPVDLSPAERLFRVARIRDGLFNLASFATPGIAGEVSGVLDRFGWSCESP